MFNLIIGLVWRKCKEFTTEGYSVNRQIDNFNRLIRAICTLINIVDENCHLVGRGATKKHYF